MFISTRRYGDYKPSIDLLVSPVEIIESGMIELLSTKEEEEDDSGYNNFVSEVEKCTSNALIIIFRQYACPFDVKRALNRKKFKNNPILSLFQYKEETFNSDINYSRICLCEFTKKEDLPSFFEHVFTEEEIQQYKTTPAEIAILKVYLGV